MKKILKKLKLLESNIHYNNYLSFYDNIDHIINRCYYDKYIVKFINKCHKNKLKIFFKLLNKFYILQKEDVINQVILLKHSVIRQHVKNMNKLINDNININADDYVSMNLDTININKSLINYYDKLIELIHIIYHFKLLEDSTNANTNANANANTNSDADANTNHEYNNLVNLGNLSNYNLSYANKGVIIIDQYSS
jgi:hypothetical protein